jgi:hypothetical protein
VSFAILNDIRGCFVCFFVLPPDGYGTRAAFHLSALWSWRSRLQQTHNYTSAKLTE